MKKLTPNNISRKKFLKTSFLAACFLPFLQYCSKAVKSFIVKISGTNHVLGHQLWAKNFSKPTETIKHRIEKLALITKNKVDAPKQTQHCPDII